MQTDSICDVVIVGAGGSGLAAAARCGQLGLSVTVLEKQPQPGGTTGMAVGSFSANRTNPQVRAGIADSLAGHVQDVAQFARDEIENRNNEQLRSFFLSHAADTLHWLSELGLKFQGPWPEPPNRLPRMHTVVPHARAYIIALRAKTLQHGGTVHCNAPVRRLDWCGNRVAGVIAGPHPNAKLYRARLGVILAAGDYANSKVLIEQFKGPAYALVDGINRHADGDGHVLAREAGARLVNMDVTYGPELRFDPPPPYRVFGKSLSFASGWPARISTSLLQLLPQPWFNRCMHRFLGTWQHPEDRLFREGAILINHQGSRFCDECQTPERELAVASQTGKQAFILLDQRLIRMFNQWPNFVSTAPVIAYAYTDDYVRRRPDITLVADMLDEIADLRRMPLERLQQTVQEVRRQRMRDGRPSLEGGRWMLLGPVRAYFTTTEGGAAINEKFQVLDQRHQVIPGLYAIGQNGLGGQILWGHGLHIAWALTSGRMVAELLAAERKARPSGQASSQQDAPCDLHP